MPASAAPSTPPAEPRPLHLGLTGNIASGKSTVARMLAERGATIIDADVLARRVVEPGTQGLAAVRERFGDGVLNADGTLSRETLRRIVFNDAVARDALNQIVHPAVRLLRDTELATARQRGDRVIISDVPLLFETGMEHSFDGVIFVDAPDEVRLQRLVEHRSLPEADARAMMSAQWPASEKRARSTFVVFNDGTVGSLANRVSDLWAQLSTMATTR